MKKSFTLLPFILSGWILRNSYTQYVDPMIGSAAWSCVCGSQCSVWKLPVQLGPVIFLKDGTGASGYHYSNNNIIGFAATTWAETGIGDLGDILGDANNEAWISIGEEKDLDNGYVSTFSQQWNCETGLLQCSAR